jgi:hypothetical protein
MDIKGSVKCHQSNATTNGTGCNNMEINEQARHEADMSAPTRVRLEVLVGVGAGVAAALLTQVLSVPLAAGVLLMLFEHLVVGLGWGHAALVALAGSFGCAVGSTARRYHRAELAEQRRKAHRRGGALVMCLGNSRVSVRVDGSQFK